MYKVSTAPKGENSLVPTSRPNETIQVVLTNRYLGEEEFGTRGQFYPPNSFSLSPTGDS